MPTRVWFLTKNSFILFDFTKLSKNVLSEISHRRYVNCLFASILAILFLPVFVAQIASGALINLPGHSPSEWSAIGRANIQTGNNSVTIQGGYAVNNRKWTDVEISFDAEAPTGAGQVQIWAGFYFRDRDSRYVFALRGGNNNDVYLARYAPDGGARFLGFAPLDFKPVPGTRYHLRLVTVGSRFEVYLNNEELPRLNVEDLHPLWTSGSVLLGGGWLPTEFSNLEVNELTDEEREAYRAVGNRQWTPRAVNKKALRNKERSEYVPQTIASSDAPRANFSLNGNWLFMPDYQLPKDSLPIGLDYDDQDWHVMPVPSFWTPGLAWLYGETSFNDLDEFSKTKGVAESLYVQRLQQCNDYTFDWHKTKSAWYRHYLDLPSDITDRNFELTFNAIAKISKIWVNGIEVGDHTGMFGQVKCDVSKAVKPGRNVIAVHVIGKQDSEEGGNKVEGVAVTVEVTSAMLHELPHGMFQNDVGGIWQPVELTETAPVHVEDCFIKPDLHGADVVVDILNQGSQAEKLTVVYSIVSVQDGTVLYSNQLDQPFVAESSITNNLELKTPWLNPNLWSPETPNLYKFELLLRSGDKIVDTYNERFGFRTFAVDGNRFLLNGKPFWLRGGDPFPNALMPNDKDLARDFIELARKGNVTVTRTHIDPFTSTWLDAADEGGMAVSFEGTWPWLMLEGEPPDDDRIKSWREEFISLIQEYRNHPSIILWTVNNEMKFELFNQDSLETLSKKWGILSDTIKAMRQTDPTRPIVADSAYVRGVAEKGYETVVKPNHFDDGDVDDQHSYYGWYNESFFHLYDGEFNQLSTPGRPLISQEMSTGYPNNDDGHPVRFYLFKHYTPQALVGDDAYENADPSLFLTRQAFMTKELVETIRRTGRETTAGLLMFSYVTWFQTPWLDGHCKPWPAYYTLKTAMQPVLVSAELYGRHFYANTAFQRRVCIVNDSDDGQAITNANLVWRFEYGDTVLSSGQLALPSIGYYSNRWLNVNFATPENLPLPRVDGQLVLQLTAQGRIISQNNYDVVIATDDWAANGARENIKVTLWRAGASDFGGLDDIQASSVDSIAKADRKQLLIVGDLTRVSLTTDEINQLREFVSGGGHVLMLHPGKALMSLFPERVTLFKAKDGEIVNMHVPESPVFSGIEPLDLAWFERKGRQLPIACAGVYHLLKDDDDTMALAQQCDIHAYLKNTTEITQFSGSPLVEIRFGAGRLMASEMECELGKTDPIARRLLSNIILYMSPR